MKHDTRPKHVRAFPAQWVKPQPFTHSAGKGKVRNIESPPNSGAGTAPAPCFLRRL
ncbi:Hypothetical predicted protein, partial [Lynx pardinus]